MLTGGLVGAPAGQHVMPQQAGQQEAGRHRLALAHPAVSVGQGLADEGLPLGLLLERAAGLVEHRVEHREHALVQAQGFERLDAGQRMAGLQQLDHLVKHARDRHVGQERRGLGDRRGSALFQREAQFGGKARGADQAHWVFTVTRGRVADQAQQLGSHVGDAVVVVDHDLGLGVVIHRVDGEVAARRILDLRAPDVVAQHPAAGVHRMRAAGQRGHAGLLVAGHLGGLAVVHVGAEGRHLDHLVVAATAMDHVHDAEAPADDEGPPEQALDLLGRGIGGHVEVLGPQAHQQVAHRAAHHIGPKAGLLQGAHHLDGALVHQRRVDAMRADRHLHPLA